MPIYVLNENKTKQIKDIVISMGGVIKRECPLRAVINGLTVDFISYIMYTPISSQEMVEAKVLLNTKDFSEDGLNKLLNNRAINSVCDVVKINLSDGDYDLKTDLTCTINNVNITGDKKVTLNKNIKLMDCKNCKISKLKFKECGIILTKVEHSLISENVCINTIEKTKNEGIRLENSKNNIIQFNRIKKYETGIILSSDSNNNIIINNYFSDNENNGIRNYSKNNIVMFNICNNDHIAAMLYDCKNNILNANIFSSKQFSLFASSAEKNNVSMNITKDKNLVVYNDCGEFIVDANIGDISISAKKTNTLANIAK